MKRKLMITIIFILSLFTLNGCSSVYKISPSGDYEEYNKVIETYALAVISDDYHTMKKYLPDNEIQGDHWLEEAKESNTPDLDTLEKMGDRYSIKGFDYFFKEHGRLYYSVEYFNYKSGHPKEPLVFGIEKTEDNQFYVINKYGRGEINQTHIKDINAEFTPMGIKRAMEEYPENTFVVKEYPEV